MTRQEPPGVSVPQNNCSSGGSRSVISHNSSVAPPLVYFGVVAAVGVIETQSPEGKCNIYPTELQATHLAAVPVV